MKTSFTVNGKVQLHLEPENVVEEACLQEMFEQGDKGVVYDIARNPLQFKEKGYRYTIVGKT